MTELQWLIKILTQHKLSASLKDLFIERIGEVEAKLSPVKAQIPPPPMFAQAPSTQKILEELAREGNPVPVPSAIIPKLPPAAIDKETGRAIVQTGKGTSGPRKF